MAAMKLGIVLPHTIQDPVSVRDFAQAIEELGFNHIAFPDYVIGGNPATHNWSYPWWITW